MFVLSLIILFVFVEQSTAVIYKLNASEYQKFPPLYVLDEYESCLLEPGSVYCDVELNLVSDISSPLLTIIKEYSSQIYTHFDHTRLQYGVCVTKRCQKFINSTEWDPKQTLEECYNATFWKEYQLKTRVSDNLKCRTYDSKMNINIFDIIVAIAFISIVALNVIGTLNDLTNQVKGDANKYLQNFSVIRNFQKLVTSTSKSDGTRLNGLDGLRTLSMMWLILLHSLSGHIIGVSNTLYIEESYYSVAAYIGYNGLLVVQIFFIVSSFLLSYNIQILAEKEKVTWSYIPKQLFSRWLRLTPPYVVLLAFACTWLRHAGDGPLWQKAVLAEVQDCHNKWWTNILYVNNYVDSRCMLQSWYVAADLQLYTLGLFVCVLIQYFPMKRLVLAFMLLLGILSPALHTYYQDLDAELMSTPELGRNSFDSSPKSNPVYRMGHTNIACSMIGIILSFCVYSLQKSAFDIQKYKKYRLLYWGTYPAMMCLMMMGHIFYEDIVRPPPLLRALYAGLMKPLYGTLVAIIIFGMVFKYENFYRSILEWRGWEIPSRVSYSAYLVQFFLINIYTGIRTNLMQMSGYHAMVHACGIIVVTNIFATVYWVLVEAPLGDFCKMYFNPRKITKTKAS